MLAALLRYSVLAFLCQSMAFGAEPAKAKEPVIICDGNEKPSFVQIDMAGFSYRPGMAGEPCRLLASLCNYWARAGTDPLPANVPFLPLVTGEPFLEFKVVNEDGAEPVTYLSSGYRLEEPEPYPPMYPPLISIAPGEDITVTTTDFIPWEGGEFSFHLEFQNKITQRRVWGSEKVPGAPVPWPRILTKPIPNVWVGRVVHDGKLLIWEGIRDENGPLRPSETVSRKIDPLRAAAQDRGRTLGERCAALASLVEMRHIHATDALSSIEKETRPDKVFHPAALKALFDIANYGTGYRSLQTFADLAWDESLSLSERALCIDMLMKFSSNQKLSHDGRVFHVISATEKRLAGSAIEKLRLDNDKLPGQLRAMLFPPKLP